MTDEVDDDDFRLWSDGRLEEEIGGIRDSMRFFKGDQAREMSDRHNVLVDEWKRRKAAPVTDEAALQALLDTIQRQNDAQA